MTSWFARFRFLIGEGKERNWIALVILAVIASVLEMAGALLVFGFFALLIQPDQLPTVPVVGDLLAQDSPSSDSAGLLPIALLVAGFFVLRGAAFLFQTYAQNRVVHNAGVRVATRLVKGYLQMPYEFHVTRNSADLIRNSYNSTLEIVLSFFLPVVSIVSQAMVVCGLVLAMLLASPAATALVVLMMGPAAFILLRVVRPRMHALGRTMHAMAAVALKSLQEGLHGVRDVKLAAKEDFVVHRFHVAKAGQARSYYLRATLAETPRVLMEAFLVLFVVVFVLIASQADPPGDSLAVLGLIGYAGLRLLPSVNRITSSVNQLHFGTPSLVEVVAELQSVESTARATESVTPMPFRRAIDVSDVSFRYQGTDASVLRAINLSISRGSFTGIVGGTGSGKSTLMDIITGLLKPTEGDVFVDDVPISQNVRGWQANLGAVSQTPFLLDSSIAMNIALGLEPGEVDEERLAHAISVAQLDEFIGSLPDGVDSLIGERGTRVSGGQRQRIAIARALYRAPEIILFDEATSALDSVTEQDLFAALHEEFAPSGTVIVIAHRLSALKRCDNIIVMDGGSIKDRGTYSELNGRGSLLGDTAKA